MLAMKAPEAVIPIDCEVSAWRSNTEECKAQCTSLLQGDRVVKYSLTRDVVTAGNEYGVSCDTFTLEKKEVCPSSACPRDCVMSDWSPWSECSAECGVGVRHRIRYVVHEALNAGKACPHTSDMDSCFKKDCNAECVLGEWSAWDSCSQTCGVGLQVRRRDILQPAIGTGVCAVAESRMRRQYRPCTTEEEVPAEVLLQQRSASQNRTAGGPAAFRVKQCSAKAKCGGKTDLVLLLDASASPELDMTKQIAAAKKLVAQLKMAEEGIKISVVAVGGPAFEQSAAHLGSAGEGRSPPSGAEVLLQWSQLPEKVTTALDDLASKKRKGFFDLWRGISLARSLFGSPGARSDARAQILVLSSSNFQPNYNELSVLEDSRFRAHSLFVKVGGPLVGTAADPSWRKLSLALNANDPKATINRTVYHFGDFAKFTEKMHEKLLPSMCGLDLVEE